MKFNYQIIIVYVLKISTKTQNDIFRKKIKVVSNSNNEEFDKRGNWRFKIKTSKLDSNLKYLRIKKDN